ncbi:AraC family transcriptional regulator [uncultured Sphingomonas sp.]|uniref:AraC family transcriptional regulator n=1 Tax=uncultured Sphingomonas sp. TaxID=158754 RepID=UPI0035CB39CE
MNVYLEDGAYAAQPLAPDTSAAVVRVDALRNFPGLVTELGGDPLDLLARAQIDPAVLDNRDAVIPYRLMVHLLERAAAELKCDDFGMRLAALQGGAKVLGPIEIAMKNSRSVGDAFRYCAEHIQAYSSAAQISIETDRAEQRSFMRFEILLSRLPYQRQVVEQALLLTYHAAADISAGEVRAREVWFSHEPLAPLSTYRRYFGCVVRFGQSSNGLFFTERDLRCPIVDPDPQLYELATCFIDSRFPAANQTMSTRVRAQIGRLLDSGECTNDRVAAALGLHPRTLQRRLREEGQCFEAIKDDFRRDVALRYLGQSGMPLTRVAEMLGYSEASVLSRSCYRWFAASPRKLRTELTS